MNTNQLIINLILITALLTAVMMAKVIFDKEMNITKIETELARQRKEQL